MSDDYNRFVNALTTLKDKVCSDIVAGPGIGSTFSIRFGTIVPTSTQNPYCRPDGPVNTTAEVNLLVKCAWRINSSTEVIACWRDNNDRDGRMMLGLLMLRGATLISICCETVTYDLTLHFSNGLQLAIFCDLSVDEDVSNYHLRILDMLYIPSETESASPVEWP